LIKFVLLVEVPEYLSDHSVGVAHKVAAVLQKKKENNTELHMDEGTDSWLIIPKSDYIDALAAGTARGGNLAMDNSFRLGPGRSTRRRRTLSRSVYMICPPG
jgi:hypothetical protein